MDKITENIKKIKESNLFEEIKQKFIEEGVSGFNERQIIEIILNYSTPQIKVAPIADRLLNKFHTIKRILDASIEDLLEIDGVTEQTAVLFKLFAGMTQFYNKQNSSEVIKMSNLSTVKKFCTTELVDAVNEEMLVICLNKNMNIIGTKRFYSKSDTHIDVPVRAITSFVLRNNCQTIILAHNHPNTPSNPSVEDLSTTSMLVSTCILNDINILDHVICSPIGTYSFVEHCILPNIVLNAFRCLKYSEDGATYLRFCAEAKEYKLD